MGGSDKMRTVMAPLHTVSPDDWAVHHRRCAPHAYPHRSGCHGQQLPLLDINMDEQPIYECHQRDCKQYKHDAAQHRFRLSCHRRS
jgi:hypothetical protein